MKESTQKLAQALGIIDHAERSSDVPKNFAVQAPDDYQSGLEALQEAQFQSALEHFDRMIANEPTSPWQQSANLNAGRALLGLVRWAAAAERFRAVIRTTAESGGKVSAPKLQAAALYHLSFCQEALGNDSQTIATLIDLQERRQFLEPEIGSAELPARLAGAYARVGNFVEADRYYREAEAGIARLRHRAIANEAAVTTVGASVKANTSATATNAPLVAPVWLGQTLFEMGNTAIDQVNWDNFESALRPLARSQIYLLEAAELNQAPWSDRAFNLLTKIYGHFWSVIESPPPTSSATVGEPVLVLRDLQAKQIDRAILLNELIESLKSHELQNEADISTQARAISVFADDLQAQIQNFMLIRPAGEGATAESMSRTGTTPHAGSGALSRSVRVNGEASSETILERKFLESSERTLPPAPKSQNKDPNL
jgi:tetratricopeptide (TPR) repeat protein